MEHPRLLTPAHGGPHLLLRLHDSPAVIGELINFPIREILCSDKGKLKTVRLVSVALEIFDLNANSKTYMGVRLAGCSITLLIL